MVNTQELVSESKCYSCFGLSEVDALELALLARIATQGISMTIFDSGNLTLSGVSVDYIYTVTQFSGVARFVRAVFVAVANDANIGAPVGAEIPVESCFWDDGTTFLYVPVVGLTVVPGEIRATTPSVLIGNELFAEFPKVGTGYSTPSSFANFVLKFYFSR